AVDAVLDAFAVRLTEGHAAAVPAMAGALKAVLGYSEPAGDLGRWLWLTGMRATALLALELWDDDSWNELASRQVRVARESGALVHLQFALNFLARAELAFGELSDAAVLVEEERAIAHAVGNPGLGSPGEMVLAACRGQAPRASELIERTERT